MRCATYRAKLLHAALTSKIKKRKRVIAAYTHHFFTTEIPDNHITDADAALDNTNCAKENDKSIARQKNRAIKYWNDNKLSHIEVMKDQVHDDVMQHLHVGKVLPIFHTLCRPPTERLFHPNTRVSVNDPASDAIELSVAPATIGECEEGHDIASEVSSNVGKISSEEEMTYIPAFFNTEGTGYVAVQDLAFQWTFNKSYTNNITTLVNEPSKMVGEDIEVTKLVKPLEVDKFSGLNLITRRLSRVVVADCFAKSKAGSTYAIVGNPGIGKSWTLIYALQQALLYENVCVLLCFQRKGIAILCIRRNDKIYVWKSDDDRWKTSCHCRLFYNTNVLVLLDPRESAEEGAVFTDGSRMLVMAASNNDRHFKATRKFTPHFARFLSLYSDKELKIAIPFMMLENQRTSVCEILERAKIVGNLPRYILSKSSFEDRQTETAKSIKKLEQDEIKDVISFDGLSQSNSTIAGCIFAVNVNLKIKSDESKSIDEDDEIDQFILHDHVGYDGHLVYDYGNVVVNILSKTVFKDIENLIR